MNMNYPWVGHDYRYFLARMLDGYVHFRQNGFVIQWFSPSFGGGLPAFPNPVHLQFTLPQLLVIFVNPWWAMLLSTSIYLVIGYYSCYRLGRDIFRLDWMASILGALFFMTTGFYIQRTAVGHLGYLLFVFVPVFAYLIFSHRWKNWQRGIGFGLLVAIFIYGVGVDLLITVGLMLLMLIPLERLIISDRIDWKNLIVVFGVGALTASFLSAGKLYAVFNYMQHFPRVIQDHFYTQTPQALVGFVMQFVGVPLFTIPLRVLSNNPETVGQMMTALVGGSELGIWEMDVSISPVLVYILFYQVRKWLGNLRGKLVIRKPKLFLRKNDLFAGLALIFGVWLAFEFTTAQGILYGLLRNLPVLRSLHVNTRYATSFVLPLAMVGAFFFDREFSRIDSGKRMRVFSFFFVATFLWLGVYFLLPNDLQSRNFNITQTLTDYQNAVDGEEFHVVDVEDVIDFQVFSSHATSLYPYEPIFGYDLEEFSTQLEPGSIYLEKNGTYNLTNPRSLVYDSDELFARFTTDQKEMMEQFAHYEQPDWNIPSTQHTLNTVSLVTFVLIVFYGIYNVVWGRRRERIRSS